MGLNLDVLRIIHAGKEICIDLSSQYNTHLFFGYSFKKRCGILSQG